MNKPYKQPLTAKSYLLITIWGLIFSIIILVFYTIYVPYIKDNNIENQLFYIILILFGISISAFLFGAMNSYASLTGKKFGSTYNFTGPIVGIILTVIGGFYFPGKAEREINLVVRVFNYNSLPLQHGEVKLYLNNEIIKKNISSDGEAIFYVPKSKAGKLKIEVVSEGYNNDTRQIEVKKSMSLDIILNKPKDFRIYGHIKNADEFPINNVEINIDNTVYYTTSVTDGSYSLSFKSFSINDEIEIITSHPKYKDKRIHVKIEEINQKLDIILAPL